MSTIGTRPARAAADTGSPPATRVRGPRWRDARLVLGVVLVLVSVVAGAKVFASADRTIAVWVVARDLDAGTVLSADDLVRRQVRLPGSSSRYVAATAVPAGYVLVRAVGEGELLPAQAIASPEHAGARRLVTVAVARNHLPPGLASGERVDVYVTPASRGGRPAEPAGLVVPAAAVSAVSDPGSRLGSSGAQVGVVLAVRPDTVARLIDAVRHGDVDLVRVPLGSGPAASRVGP